MVAISSMHNDPFLHHSTSYRIRPRSYTVGRESLCKVHSQCIQCDSCSILSLRWMHLAKVNQLRNFEGALRYFVQRIGCSPIEFDALDNNCKFTTWRKFSHRNASSNCSILHDNSLVQAIWLAETLRGNGILHRIAVQNALRYPSLHNHIHCHTGYVRKLHVYAPKQCNSTSRIRKKLGWSLLQLFLGRSGFEPVLAQSWWLQFRKLRISSIVVFVLVFPIGRNVLHPDHDVKHAYCHNG